MEKEQDSLVEGLGRTKKDYEFADLSHVQLDRLKEVERQLVRDREKETVLLAYDKRDD